MPPPIPRPLVVHPNPFHALDAHGRPACVVHEDPSVNPTRRAWLGASLNAELIEKRPDGDGRYDIHDRTWTFDLAPKRIADTIHHRRSVLDGSLIAGDMFTARRCSAPHRVIAFRPVAEVLAEEQAAACAAWRKEHPIEEGDEETPVPASLLDVATLCKEHADAAAKTVEAERGFVAEHAAAAKKAADEADAKATAKAAKPALVTLAAKETP